MIRISEHIETIILRQFNKQATPAELALLDQWLAQNPDHREAYSSLRHIWKESGVTALSFNTEAAWERVTRRIAQPTARVVRLYRWKTALSIAAALILLVGLPVLYFRTAGDPGVWKEVVASRNLVMTLPDSSRVSLRKGSLLRYLTPFGEAGREVTLAGEAYFEIRHREHMPFRITTRQSVVTDLGTAFLLRTSDSLDQVTVTEGAVRLARRQRPHHHLILLPGQQGALSGTLLLKKENKGSNLLSWKQEKLRFAQAPLTQVAEDLEHYYGIRFALAPSVPAQTILITVQFNAQPLEQVLEELELVTGLSFMHKDNLVLVQP